MHPKLPEYGAKIKKDEAALEKIKNQIVVCKPAVEDTKSSAKAELEQLDQDIKAAESSVLGSMVENLEQFKPILQKEVADKIADILMDASKQSAAGISNVLSSIATALSKLPPEMQNAFKEPLSALYTQLKTSIAQAKSAPELAHKHKKHKHSKGSPKTETEKTISIDFTAVIEQLKTFQNDINAMILSITSAVQDLKSIEAKFNEMKNQSAELLTREEEKLVLLTAEGIEGIGKRQLATLDKLEQTLLALQQKVKKYGNSHLKFIYRIFNTERYRAFSNSEYITNSLEAHKKLIKTTKDLHNSVNENVKKITADEEKDKPINKIEKLFNLKSKLESSEKETDQHSANTYGDLIHKKLH